MQRRTHGMSWILTGLLYVAGSVGMGVGTAAAQDAKPPAESAEAKAELARAAGLVEALKGVKGPERLDGMRRAAEAYAGVATAFAGEPLVAVRAGFEAGECWRRAGEFEAAARAYGQVLSGAPGRFEQRAAFERAGVLRRLERFDEALADYRRAAKVEPDNVRAHEARVWVAKVLESQGEVDAAMAAFRAAVDAATGPRRTVEACDELAKALVRRGDLAGAAAALDRAATAAAPVIEAGGEDSARMRKILEELGARRQLQRARDRAQGTARDAMDVEAVLGKQR
jgi:tetratricopeptide (TPR) repeat protein